MRKYQKLVKIAAMALFSLICVAFLISPSVSAKGKVYELTFATQHPAEAPMNKVVNTAWAQYLAKASNGRLKIVLFPAEQAAKAPDAYDACRTGLVDIACQMHAYASGRFPLSEVTSLPFVIQHPGSRAAALTMMALHNKYPEIQAEYKGVKVLGFHANGCSHIHTVKKPVKRLEDLKGLVMFVVGKYGVQALKELGCSPTSLIPTELYDAMSKGVLDGNFQEWEGQFIWKLNELTKYSTELGMSLFTFVHVMNNQSLKKLPKDLQDIFLSEESMKVHELHGYNFDKDDLMFREMLDKQYKKTVGEGIYVLPDDEKARWKEAVTPVLEGWVKDNGKNIDEAKARAILADAIQLSKEFSGMPDEACPDCKDTLKAWGAPGY